LSFERKRTDTLNKIESGFKKDTLKTEAFSPFFNETGNYSNIAIKSSSTTQFNSNISNIALKRADLPALLQTNLLFS